MCKIFNLGFCRRWMILDPAVNTGHVRPFKAMTRKVEVQLCHLVQTSQGKIPVCHWSFPEETRVEEDFVWSPCLLCKMSVRFRVLKVSTSSTLDAEDTYLERLQTWQHSDCKPCSSSSITALCSTSSPKLLDSVPSAQVSTSNTLSSTDYYIFFYSIHTILFFVTSMLLFFNHYFPFTDDCTASFTETDWKFVQCLL